ncbi:MAG: hypothetical protein WCP57_06285 [Bacteroidota bacterium]
MKEKLHQNHACDQIMSKVILSLDGALSPDEEKKFLEEINQCSCCLGKYEIEKSFKEFLAQKVSKSCCFETLAQSIKQKIKHNRN